jgi:hypothetical protein
MRRRPFTVGPVSYNVPFPMFRSSKKRTMTLKTPRRVGLEGCAR